MHNIRSQVLRCAIAALVCGAWMAAAAADDLGVLQHAHAWGRFAKGSWRQVRITTESFDEQGKLTSSSVTDNTTTVQEVTPERVTLKVEATVETAGGRMPSEPQIVKQGYAGDDVGQNVTIRTLPAERLMVDGREIVCETRQIEIVRGSTKEVSMIHVAPQLTPAIIKRTSTTREVATAKTTQEATSEVKALDLSLPVLGHLGMKNAYLVRMDQRNAHGSTTTWSWHVTEVPGEVVASSTKKFDGRGRLVRQSTLEMVGYGGSVDEPSREPMTRRARRAKRGR